MHLELIKRVNYKKISKHSLFEKILTFFWNSLLVNVFKYSKLEYFSDMIYIDPSILP